MVTIQLSDRDYKILQGLGKWRFLLSRHIKVLYGISSERTMYRRLKQLMDNGYIERKRLLFDVPNIYTLSHKGLLLLGLNKRKEKIRIDTLRHNILVIDTLIYMLENELIDKQEDVISEKELNREIGFTGRKHQPDSVFVKDGKRCAVEIELTAKPIGILTKNIKANFTNYDEQIWILEKRNTKIERNINAINQPDLSILYYEEFI